jgi:GntR family phosphonate transport system transcriptional regulator
MERQTGIAMWRQIADEIRQSIAGGEYAAREILPGEMALAERFGVNRHTVRSAIAALVREGVLRAERGRGTFVEKRDRLRFRVGPRTRFSEGIAGQSSSGEGRLLRSGTEEADSVTADALGIAAGEKLVRVEMLYLVDRIPISVATNFFPAERFGDIAGHVRRTRSITAALAACGVGDYSRKWTTITARHADTADRQALSLSPGAIVLHGTALNVDAAGTAIQYANTRFAADRVELTVD